jgi:hypothetical protein
VAATGCTWLLPGGWLMSPMLWLYKKTFYWMGMDKMFDRKKIDTPVKKEDNHLL